MYMSRFDPWYNIHTIILHKWDDNPQQNALNKKYYYQFHFFSVFHVLGNERRQKSAYKIMNSIIFILNKIIFWWIIFFFLAVAISHNDDLIKWFIFTARVSDKNNTKCKFYKEKRNISKRNFSLQHISLVWFNVHICCLHRSQNFHALKYYVFVVCRWFTLQ